MGMTINEAIKDIELTCEYLKNIGVFDTPANERCKPSLDMAIDTMRKYQKIEQILKDIPYGGEATVRRIQEVVEDGNGVSEVRI